MNATLRNYSASLILAALGSAATAQGPGLLVSLDPASPEVSSGAASAADLGDAGGTPGDPGWIAHFAADLGLPSGAVIDASCHGFAQLGADNVAQFTAALCFSVDRNSAGMPGGTVFQQVQNNGAANDIFRIDWPGAPQVTLAIDMPQLVQTQGSGQTDIDALRFDFGYPVFFSVDAVTAQALGVSIAHTVSAADVFVVHSQGAQPEVFVTARSLGLIPEDDIDALVMGPEGLLYSLTRSSPSALATPDVGGAGLFFGGRETWATAADMQLLPSDELDALEAETGAPRYRHSLLLPGQSTHFRCEQLQPGDTAYFFASLQPPLTLCVPGIICLDILPEFRLGLAPADPDGTAQTSLPLPTSMPPLRLATQAVVLTPQLNLIATNVLLFDIAHAVWGWQPLTLSAQTNGYTLDSGRGNHRLLIRGATDNSGNPLNGQRPVTLYFSVNGVAQPPKQAWIQFTNGAATFGSGVGANQQIQITSVGISLRPGE